MQSKATTVAAYLSALPADRRAALEAVRKVILKNLDKDIEEVLSYGMIGYAIPHRVFPAGYHCDPKMPLPFGALASQKNYMSVYLMSIYLSSAEEEWFQQQWAKTGKKLDMGKSCIRFKKLEDLALDVIGQAVKRVSAKKYIANYEETLAKRGQGGAKSARGASASAKPHAAKSKTPARKGAARKRARAK